MAESAFSSWLAPRHGRSVCSARPCARRLAGGRAAVATRSPIEHMGADARSYGGGPTCRAPLRDRPGRGRFPRRRGSTLDAPQLRRRPSCATRAATSVRPTTGRTARPARAADRRGSTSPGARSSPTTSTPTCSTSVGGDGGRRADARGQPRHARLDAARSLVEYCNSPAGSRDADPGAAKAAPIVRAAASTTCSRDCDPWPRGQKTRVSTGARAPGRQVDAPRRPR